MRFGIYKRFTLIELLVILSLITILLLLLAPALQNAMEKGEEIACASKLNQIGRGTQLYLNDNKGLFWKYGEKRAGIPFASGYWPEFIDDLYMGDKYGKGQNNTWGVASTPMPDTVYYCQSTSMENNNNPMNYVMNLYLLDMSPNKWHSTKGFGSIIKIPVPDQVSIFSEGNYLSSTSRASAYYIGSHSFRSTQLFTPHDEQTVANSIYADGHISSQDGILGNEQIGRADLDPSLW